MSGERVVVAMSGGVDSSVAAALLLEQGYEVIGITMRLWSLDASGGLRNQRRCCSVEDTDDARRVCQALGIPHYVLNMEERFREDVVNYFTGEYALGRTPNPCLACNERVKFRPLLQKALAFGADYLATGHYARTERTADGYCLLKAVDLVKDQSYVLFQLGQGELRRLLFPVGGATKPEIREVARRHGLPNADKPDSADICFIPTGDLRGFIGERIDLRPGPIVDRAGEVLGEHGGIATLTVGQRKGLGIAGGRPLYVLALDPVENAAVVGPDEALFVTDARAGRLSFVAGEPPATAFDCSARVRYHAAEAPASVRIEGDRAFICFAEPQRAVTPGQAVVFYDGDRVIGGGILDR